MICDFTVDSCNAWPAHYTSRRVKSFKHFWRNKIFHICLVISNCHLNLPLEFKYKIYSMNIQETAENLLAWPRSSPSKVLMFVTWLKVCQAKNSSAPILLIFTLSVNMLCRILKTWWIKTIVSINLGLAN